MIDQRVSEGENVPFFGKGALTTTLPAQLAIKFKCEIIPIYISRTENDNFKIEIYDPLKINMNDISDRNKLQITETLNKILESMILKNPGQWIWTHNRWK